MNLETIKPTGSNVLLKYSFEETTTESGLILRSEPVKHALDKHGEVIAAGPRCEYVKAGDFVCYDYTKPTGQKLNDPELSSDIQYCMVDEKYILAIVEK